ncbi:MAG: hydantoinase/oxoprolinase N-terminal domain-containing protein [Chloroflexota bacterium]
MTPTPTVYTLGIDTGGTFTDGVLLDPTARRVARSAKVLTTHHDLQLCIRQVLAELLDSPAPPESGEASAAAPLAPEIALVSLSTTLATNAIVEEKRRPAALLLLGYDRQLVETFQFHKGFGTPHYFFISGRHDLSSGQELEALDEAAVLQAAGQCAGVEAYAVSAYAGPANAAHELRAAELLEAATRQPVVQAHHLSSELNSILRATTASLNASLLGNTRQLLDAVQTELARRGVHCPLMMVRGDASIVQAAFARRRPVEVVHSGPATSAIGGQFLSRLEQALVADVGGTTTDLSLIEAGRPTPAHGAATVGSYQTCIDTIRSRSFGLGCDSRIVFDHHGRLAIGPQRAIPISRLCAVYPGLRADLLAALGERQRLLYSESYEYWVLRRVPTVLPADPLTRRIIDLLRAGPLRYSAVRQAIGPVSPFHIDELVQAEIIDRAALTPTDLLHIRGEFNAWDTQAALALVETAARTFDEPPAAFMERVQQHITRRIVAEVLQFVSRRQLSAEGLAAQPGRLDRWLFEQAVQPDDPHLQVGFKLRMPLVGIGAPARAFLPRAAEILGAELIIPAHHAVANAVGAVVSSVVCHHQAQVLPNTAGATLNGYFACVANTRRLFSSYEAALAYARQALLEHVEAQAQAAGAGQVDTRLHEAPIWEGMARLDAWAVGLPALGAAASGNAAADQL